MKTTIMLIIDGVKILYNGFKAIYILPVGMNGKEWKAWKLRNCDWSL